MKNHVSTFLFLLTSIIIYSQENYNSESYIVTLNDITTSSFKKDSTAKAVVIYEHGNSYVHKNEFDLRTEIQRKIKILTNESFKNADITIPLYINKDSKEKVKNINATTYNLINGKVIKMSINQKDIFKEEHDENHTLIKFTLPNIKVGSVITYSYTLISPFMFNYKAWNFQDDIPKLYSEYVTSIPANWEYNIKLVGSEKLVINETKIKKYCLQAANGSSSDCFEARYAMKDIPAFIEEDYMTSKSNYLARIDYELKTFKGFDGRVINYTKSWKTVDNELKTQENIGQQLKKSVHLEDFINLEVINETDDFKRAKSIYEYVQNNYTWNEEYKIFKDVSVKDLIKNKSGNVSSINILLHNLLEEANIDVKPVLISTRDNGYPTQLYPVISDFNYLIIQATINNKTYLLDATDKYLSFGMVPLRCLNKYGRLLDFKNGSRWIDINDEMISSVQYKIELKLDGDEHMTGSVNSKISGYHALKFKKEYFKNKENYLKNLEDSFPYGEISNFEVTNDEITSKIFSESYDVSYDSDDSGLNIYLNPFFIKFFTSNPFKLQERTYPIDFGHKNSFLYMLKLNFNKNYSVIERPNDISLSLPNGAGKIIFTSILKENALEILFKIDLRESVYAHEYYPYLKEFMNKIIDIQKNSIFLLKKV